MRAVSTGALLVLIVGIFSTDYTVERGDTLARIAREHDVSLTELIDANDLANPNLIYPGQVLIIPGQGEPDIVHVVGHGDTLGRIASRYGTSVSALVEANGISNPNLIRIGQQITVPAGGGSGSGGGGTESFERSGRYHVVKRGERLDTIASQYKGVSAEQIARANGIVGGTIYAGTRLFLDGPSFVGEGVSGSEVTYKVRSGDRLGDIAHQHGVSVSSIVSRNKISNPNLIRVGQSLSIAGGAAWVCPVDGATFFNDWGFPRGAKRFHEGNDLFAPKGTPVRAPVSGTVEFITGSIGGKQFNLHGDDGVEYLGSHMSDFGKSGKVSAGDVIGYIGTSGNAQGTSPHLHFGMYLKGGVVINPYPTLVENGCK